MKKPTVVMEDGDGGSGGDTRPQVGRAVKHGSLGSRAQRDHHVIAFSAGLNHVMHGT